MGWHMINSFLNIMIVMCVITLWIMPSHSSNMSTCIFDMVKMPKSNLSRCSLKYKGSHDAHDPGNTSSRTKRSIDDLFEPIRMTVQFHDLEDHLDMAERERLKRVLVATVDKVKDIFRVIPVNGPLLLARSSGRSCKTVLQSGINSGKCLVLKPDYTGEYCLDNFKVPEAHLEGLYVWNASHLAPVDEVYSPGPGLPQTDYVLYVRSLFTDTCLNQGPNTIAYAAYCQVDQNDRPVAGYINFCPELFKESVFDEKKVAVTALHEIFHALGFASDLFPKFKDCTQTASGVECTDKHKTLKEVQNAERLVTSKVVNLTSAHFGCRSHVSVNEFGPILQTENGIVKSHWDTAFMHSSLMVPNIGSPHDHLVDPITLAVFEDSGWYRVNYNYADTFLWGKGGGCEFGLNPSCEMSDSSYFCSGSSAGCHFLQFAKGQCDTDASLHQCRVFKKLPEHAACYDFTSSPPAQNLVSTGEAYDRESRCFLANLTLPFAGTPPPTLMGCCLKHRCNGSEVYVRAGNSPYCHCPPEEIVKVPGYNGVVKCPPAGIMCNQEDTVLTTAPTTVTSTETPPVIKDTSGLICVDIVYSSSTVDLTSTKLILFQNCNLDTILLWTRISRRRLEDFYVLQDTLTFRFTLLPRVYENDGAPSEEVCSKLYDTVKNGSFQFFLPPRGPTYVATDMIQFDVGPTMTNKETPTVVIAGAAVGAVCGAIVLGVLVFLLQRHCSLQRQRTARSRQRRTDSMSSHRARSTPNTPRSNSERPEPPRWGEGSRCRSQRSNHDRQEEGDLGGGQHKRPSISSEGDTHNTSINVVSGDPCCGGGVADSGNSAPPRTITDTDHGVTIVI